MHLYILLLYSRMCSKKKPDRSQFYHNIKLSDACISDNAITPLGSFPGLPWVSLAIISGRRLSLTFQEQKTS